MDNRPVVTADEAIFEAIHANDIAAVRAMLASGIAPDSVGRDGMSILLVATSTNDRAMIQSVLDAGADPHFACAPDCLAKFNGTPLNYACANGLESAISALLDADADPAMTSENGNNAAHHLLGNNSPKTRLEPEAILAILKRMLEKGLSANSANGDGIPLLRYGFVSHVPLGVLGVLLDYGADPHHAKEEGCQIIHMAASRPRLDMLRLLVERGVDVNTADDVGRTPLFYAGSPEALHLLSELGADIHHTDHKGRNALIYLAEEGDFHPLYKREMAILVELGVDPRQEDNDGRSVLSLFEDHRSKGNAVATEMLALIAAKEAMQSMRDVIGRRTRPIQP